MAKLQSVTHNRLHTVTSDHTRCLKTSTHYRCRIKEGKVLPYLLPNVGPRADPGVQAVRQQVTVLKSSPMVVCHYFPLACSHGPSTNTKLYCLVTEAHRCEQLAQGCYAALPCPQWESNPQPIDHKSNAPPSSHCCRINSMTSNNNLDCCKSLQVGTITLVKASFTCVESSL